MQESNNKPSFIFQIKWLNCIAVLAVLFTALNPAPAMSEVTVQTDFTVEVFADVVHPTGLAFAPAGSAFGSDLYVASYNSGQELNDYIYTVAPSGSVSTFTALVPEADPVALEFPPAGGSFDNFLYISANNRDFGRPGDCGGVIQRADSQGNVSDFTSLESCIRIGLPLPPNLGLGEPVDIAFGPGRCFGTDLFVANSSDPPADIMRVDSNGASSIFVDDGKFSSLATYGLAPVGVEFSPGGDFGNLLYFVDFGEGCNCIRTADPNGAFSSPFINVQGDVRGIKFGPGGPFGSYLYASVYLDGGDNSILKINPDGTYSVFASGFPAGSFTSDGLEFSKDGTALFVSAKGGDKIYKISYDPVCP